MNPGKIGQWAAKPHEYLISEPRGAFKKHGVFVIAPFQTGPLHIAGPRCWNGKQIAMQSEESKYQWPTLPNAEGPQPGSTKGLPPDFVPLHEERRTHISTRLMCAHMGRAEQTARGWACNEDGPLRPIRVNGRLAWPVADIKRLLGMS